MRNNNTITREFLWKIIIVSPSTTLLNATVYTNSIAVK